MAFGKSKEQPERGEGAIARMLGEKEGAAFMPYVCCGDPYGKFTERLIETLARNGADAIELGIPFSDPVADGKALQLASSRAISAGMTPGKALVAVKKARKAGVEIPIIIMAYSNAFYSQGIGRFLRKARGCGADGVIVPDMPLEESEGFRQACKNEGLSFIPLVSPDCTEGRIRKIAKGGSGFIYAVSVIGTTGARKSVEGNALSLVGRAKRASGMKVAAGFGISLPMHARKFAQAGADGIIVGSRIAQIYMQGAGKRGWERAALARIAKYCREMKDACKAGF